MGEGEAFRAQNCQPEEEWISEQLPWAVNYAIILFPHFGKINPAPGLPGGFMAFCLGFRFCHSSSYSFRMIFLTPHNTGSAGLSWGGAAKLYVLSGYRVCLWMCVVKEAGGRALHSVTGAREVSPSSL